MEFQCLKTSTSILKRNPWVGVQRFWGVGSVRLLVLVWLVFGRVWGNGGESVPGVKGFLGKHCIGCHDSEVRKGGLDLTLMDWEPAKAWGSRDWDAWIRVYDRVSLGEMPPVGRAAVSV